VAALRQQQDNSLTAAPYSLTVPPRTDIYTKQSVASKSTHRSVNRCYRCTYNRSSTHKPCQ
jgi:hypothetical protein